MIVQSVSKSALFSIRRSRHGKSKTRTHDNLMAHSGQVMYYDPSLNQPFVIIQNFFDRNDPYIILNQNFKIVVLGAGCAQLFFSEFRAENGT